MSVGAAGHCIFSVRSSSGCRPTTGTQLNPRIRESKKNQILERPNITWFHDQYLHSFAAQRIMWPLNHLRCHVIHQVLNLHCCNFHFHFAFSLVLDWIWLLDMIFLIMYINPWIALNLLGHYITASITSVLIFTHKCQNTACASVFTKRGLLCGQLHLLGPNYKQIKSSLNWKWSIESVNGFTFVMFNLLPCLSSSLFFPTVNVVFVT